MELAEDEMLALIAAGASGGTLDLGSDRPERAQPFKGDEPSERDEPSKSPTPPEEDKSTREVPPGSPKTPRAGQAHQDVLTAVSVAALRTLSHDHELVSDGLRERLVRVATQIRSRFAAELPLTRIAITPTQNGGARFVWLGPKAGNPQVMRELESNGSLREGETAHHLIARLGTLMWTICRLTGADDFKVQLRDRPKDRSAAQAETLGAMRGAFG